MGERSSRGGRVAIIGGGLSGLSAAHRLMTQSAAGRRPIELMLLEGRDRVGGAVWTRRRDDGYTLEGGADSFLTTRPHGVDLCRSLGLAGQLVGTDPANRRSFVVRQGRPVPVPEGFELMAPGRLLPMLTTPILSWRGKLRLLLDWILPRRGDDGPDESLAAFVRRRLGRETLERLVQPLVAGIDSTDPAELSLRATLPQFLAMEQRHGGLIRGGRRQADAARAEAWHESGARYGRFVTLAEGMGALPEALARSLPPGAVRLGAAVRRLVRPDPAGPWRVEMLDGSPLDADAVVLATEAPAAARLVDGLDPGLAQGLRAIPYASTAIVHIAYPRDRIAHPLDGFGVVIPRIEGRSILAVSFTSVKFPMRAPAGHVLMRVFLGGATQPELLDLEDEALVALARRELGELLGAVGAPSLVEVARHARAMPQFLLGHLDRIETVRGLCARHGGLFLAGNYLDGVGIPDCIRSGQAAADAVLASLAALDGAVAA